MENVSTFTTLDEKAQRLRQILGGCNRLIVAYSGGIDSAFLAWMAHQVLGSQMLAVIADSASLARTHLEDALAFAREHEIPVEVVETQETGKSRLRSQRCHALLSLQGRIVYCPRTLS